MPIYTRHDAVDHALQLIKDGKYVVDSDWSESQPSAEDENRFLEKHSWEDYRKWFLGKDTEDNKDTKGRYMFPYGDFEKVHRSGVIAAKQRAAQNDYHTVEQAADELLQLIDELEEKDK